MNAMIFAAGLGTRLQHFTGDKPKALVEVQGRPLLEWAIRKLLTYGFDRIMVNVHHYADLVVDFLERSNFNAEIHISDETDALLDTGGGLKKCSWFFDDSEPFLVHNVDVLSDIDLKSMLAHHKSTQAQATLAVSERQTSRYLLFDANNRMRGWKNIKTGEIILPDDSQENLKSLAFSGIHLISPDIFQYFPPDESFSIIKVYLELVSKFTIGAFRHDDSFWMDLGKPEELEIAQGVNPEKFI